MEVQSSSSECLHSCCQLPNRKIRKHSFVKFESARTSLFVGLFFFIQKKQEIEKNLKSEIDKNENLATKNTTLESEAKIVSAYFLCQFFLVVTLLAKRRNTKIKRKIAKIRTGKKPFEFFLTFFVVFAYTDNARLF